MPASEVEICNDALDRLGAGAIVALDEGSEAARRCNRQYPLARDYILARYPWSCATTRARLAASATAPAWGYAYAYPVPPDCLRVVQVADDDQGTSWRVEGGAVLADEAGPLDVRYIRRVTDPGAFSPHLADAIAARLASRIAYPLTGNAAMARDMFSLSEATLREAMRLDALEQSQDEVVGATLWTDARFTATGTQGGRFRRISTPATTTVPTTPGPSGPYVPVYGP